MKPRLAYAILIFFLLVTFVTGIFVLSRQQTCSESYRHDGQVRAGSHKINVQIAKNSQEIETGLAGKKCLADNQGMLFKFDKPGYYPFWMKDTHMAIDIVWIDASHRVTDISSNIQPDTYPKNFTNTAPAKDVLELKAGEASKLGLGSGSYISY